MSQFNWVNLIGSMHCKRNEGVGLYKIFSCHTGFLLYFGIEIQGLFKDFQGPWSCIFKDQFSTEVYSMDSITAIFNTGIYFCDYGTVLVDKNKTW